MNLICLDDKNRNSVDQYIRDEWGGPMIVTLGNIYDARTLPGYIAVENDHIVGAVLYRLAGRECEVAALYSLTENHGIGTALLKKVIVHAGECGCRRVWLVTTNDNTHAIRFYQKFGLSLKAVHINSFEIIRKLKPGLPDCGIDGIPLAHEFEFEYLM